jgi:hypothetical protein
MVNNQADANIQRLAVQDKWLQMRLLVKLFSDRNGYQRG